MSFIIDTPSNKYFAELAEFDFSFRHWFIQAVHVHIVDFAEGDGVPHRKWENPETPEELEEEKSIKSLPYDVWKEANKRARDLIIC